MTIKEVAKLAGVSTASISRYFNGGIENDRYPNPLSDFEVRNGNGLDFYLKIYIKLRE